MDKISEIDTIYGNEKLKVTCVERKYKVVSPRVTYLITAKKELEENITERLLHEDMELKTFLTYYEITNIILPVHGSEDVDLVKRKEHGKIPKSATTRNISTIRTNAQGRRELFDFLNLPEEFIIKDYKEALEEKGIKITNTAMPYDDLVWLQEKGKVIKLDKNENNKITYKKVKKEEANEIANNMEIDKTIKSLKDGQKVLMGTIKDS